MYEGWIKGNVSMPDDGRWEKVPHHRPGHRSNEVASCGTPRISFKVPRAGGDHWLPGGKQGSA